MAKVEYRNVGKVYGDGTRALEKFNLAIEDGELMVLVGPSGCGKSTALRLLAGLERQTSGEIFIGTQEVTYATPQQRDVAMVFQNYALYPHMNVYRNLEFPLRMMKMPKEDRKRRIKKTATLLGLGDLLRRRPRELSGGQRQRVAMGRAIVRDPKVFLMDEPLSNLDAGMRVRLRTEIAALQNRLHATTIYVTHDQVEAMSLGNRVAVLNQGRLQQVDTPETLYDRPANSFVAGFIGNPGMNLLPARLQQETNGIRVHIGGQLVGCIEVNSPLYARLQKNVDQSVSVGMRPEHLRLWREGSSSPSFIKGSIKTVELLGHEHLVYLELQEVGGRHQALLVRLHGHPQKHAGEIIIVQIDEEKLYFFDAEGRVL